MQQARHLLYLNGDGDGRDSSQKGPEFFIRARFLLLALAPATDESQTLELDLQSQ